MTTIPFEGEIVHRNYGTVYLEKGGWMAKEKMNVTIDRDGCISCGACWSTCPDVFEQNQDDGHSQIVAKYRASAKLGEGEISRDLEGCARNAADGCPVQVIRVE